MPLVPGHVYELAGLTVGNGNYVSLDWSEMFFAGPITRPVGMFARGVFGVGGSGLGMGLSMNVSPRCPGATICWRDDDDYFIGPFVSLEGRIERTYNWDGGWPNATYVGPQLTVSALLKASVGWMVDVTNQSNNRVQVGFGEGF
jgi:hypothetical protein